MEGAGPILPLARKERQIWPSCIANAMSQPHAYHSLPQINLNGNGQIVGQPRKGECRKMSDECPKMSRNCPEGLKTQFSDIFWTILPIWSMLLFGDPVQCSPVTMQQINLNMQFQEKIVCAFTTYTPWPELLQIDSLTIVQRNGWESV